MADIFGTPLEQAILRVGSLDQVARVDRFVEDDGPARGARRFRVVNGGGLDFDVHPDRGLDIGAGFLPRASPGLTPTSPKGAVGSAPSAAVS